jgi:hypothetical protein
MITQDWKPLKSPKALLIGHDPRLQTSDTIAEYALFANYFFDISIKDKAFKHKYGLSASAFSQITEITNGKIKPDEIYVTNFCNSALPHAPKGKTVFISLEKAKEGFDNILRILQENPGIEYVFPMSLQVNYWLQKLGLYDSENGFVESSTPRESGIQSVNPYFEPAKPRTFLLVCGNKYKALNTNQVVIPILHAKCYPLNDRFKAYRPAYKKIMAYFNL